MSRYAKRLLDLNEYLASFLGATMDDKIGVTEINEIILKSIPKIWYRQEYVKGFDCEYIYFKKAVNMFESMEINKSIYEGVVTPSYRKTTWAESNRTGIIRKREDEPPCQILTMQRMGALTSAVNYM